MSKPHVVAIVDDDDIYRYTIVKNIQALQVSKKILVFKNGAEVLEYMLENMDKVENLPDTILLDVNMPVMDGFEFIEEYEKFEPEIKSNITVFMISSSINPADINRAKSNAEISDYITKPIGSSKLQRIFPNQ